MSIPATTSSLETLNGLIEHEPAWWVDVCARIAAGAGYWEIAQERAIKPALFRGWIGGDAKREKDYQTALEYRQEYRNELAAARLAGFVGADVRDEDINPAHVLKAIESTLGKGGPAVRVDANITIVHESA